MKLSGMDLLVAKLTLQFFKSCFVLNNDVYVRRMVVGRTTVLIRIFNAGMCRLNSLMGGWEIAARDDVKVGVISLRLHDVPLSVAVGESIG